MSRSALIDSAGVVVNIIIANPGYTPPEGFNVIFDIPMNVAAGWTYSEGTFSPPDPGPGDTIEQMRAARILAMKAEATARLDSTVGTETRELMQDNILDPGLADRIADYSLALRNAVNTAIDQVNAATDEAGVNADEPVWPVFDGGVLP